MFCISASCPSIYDLCSYIMIKQANEFLHDVFGFTPKKKYLGGVEHHLSGTDKVGVHCSYEFASSPLRLVAVLNLAVQTGKVRF